MSEFETALREALRRRAGEPDERSMPLGTKRRVRRRQLITGGAGAAIAVAAILLTTVILAGLSRGAWTGPAAGTCRAQKLRFRA